MYYYDTGECILNSKNRATNSALITNDTMNMRVDYFENICYDVHCLTNFMVHWIKVKKFAITDQSKTVINQVTKEQCFNYCLENKIGNQSFPCKLYAYSESEMICHLTSESSQIHSTTDNNQKTSDNLEQFDFYEKICLRGTLQCQDNSFEHISDHALLNTENKVTTTSMTGCLEICLNSGKECSSVMFFHDTNECALSKMSQYSRTEQLRYIPEVDYFDNVCDYKITATVTFDNKITEMPMIIPRMHRQLSELETECGKAGILISVLFSKPTIGVIFIKDHFATCRAEFNNTMNATIEIALYNLRRDNPPCPGYETNPFVWSFIVVVQKNGLGIPGLMTDNDLVFNITCDYSNSQTTIDSTQHEIVLQEEVSRDWLPNADHVRLTVFRGDQPVSVAVLGEELEMRWTVINDSMDSIGLFVNQCIAERLDGTKPLPPPLTLIKDGCIDNKVSRLLMQHPIIQYNGGLKTKIKVFRFDGSHRVRILCSVDICIDECIPVACDGEISDNTTNSRKKKREIFLLPPQKISEKGIKRQLITGTFTIVDENVNSLLSENLVKTDEQSLNQDTISFQFPDENYFCIQNLAFLILITVTVILLTMQIFLLYKYRKLKTQLSASSDIRQCNNITSIS